MSRTPRVREGQCCAKCGGASRVIDCYGQPDTHEIRRRRKCVLCGQRWNTVEQRAGALPSKAAVIRDDAAIRKAAGILGKLIARREAERG